jgi:hypothetical protein
MPNPVTALTTGASLLSSRRQAKAAESAASMQAEAAGEGIAEQRRQFDSLQALLQPYTQAGVPALQAQQAFLGLRGPEEEQAAIDRLTGGSTFQELTRQGEEAILSRASATGGLRGGNVQAALAQFRPQLLNQLIEQQFGRLGGLTTLGQRSAAGVGTARMESGENVSNLLAQQGQASAGGELGRARAFGQMLNIPSQIAGAGGFGGSKGFTDVGGMGAASNDVLREYGIF